MEEVVNITTPMHVTFSHIKHVAKFSHIKKVQTTEVEKNETFNIITSQLTFMMETKPFYFQSVHFTYYENPHKPNTFLITF